MGVALYGMLRFAMIFGIPALIGVIFLMVIVGALLPDKDKDKAVDTGKASPGSDRYTPNDSRTHYKKSQ